jgi:DNA-binding Lrp family transcriptional regulator
MPSSKKKAGLASTSELARRTGLHRSTVRERLQKHNVEPKQEGVTEKLYDEEEALKAVQGEGVSGLKKAQAAKAAVEAARGKLKYDKERGELVSIQDVREDVQEFVKRVHEHFAVTGPTVLAPQLRGKKVSQIEAALKRDAEDFFNDLRATYKAFL